MPDVDTDATDDDEAPRKEPKTAASRRPGIMALVKVTPDKTDEEIVDEMLELIFGDG